MIKLGSSTIKEMYLGSKKIKQAYLGSQLIYNSGLKQSVTVDLKNQWILVTHSNPDEELYTMYESYSNVGIHNSYASMTITITGYTQFTCYIRSYAETTFDYVMISQLDQSITGDTSYSNTTLVKAHTRGNQQSDTSIYGYTEVVYDNIDGGTHTITVVYRKDSSQSSNDDKGYILVPSIDIQESNTITATVTVGPSAAFVTNGGYPTVYIEGSNGRNHTFTGTTYTFECTKGVTYIVSADPITDWNTPSQYTFTAGANGVAHYNIAMTYTKQVTYITFYTPSSMYEYTAEEGMTWYEWVNSEYAPTADGNVPVYVLNGNTIRNVYSGGTIEGVTPGDIIQAGVVYPEIRQ